ncbi:hypothetical protein [Kibdelosporangium phytohabitans]|uniref:Guanylate cyclase domain-containing protein n=1 Tax=Kibdelosporangium phytohabitans TaxID=860235 RepID=A0A0N9I4T5_9PSEU|nr:hypothetical protein [Kibdelosporangium phytohabitans]ALG09654.1 hypothetical protein AOZ06_24565 [Kibdelosporangium phytohabitans]MBE1469002.1 hypothetical protein [Kibdelosporangium phytohabitans]
MDSQPSEVNPSLGELVGILAVDVRRFSRHNDTQQRKIVDQLPQVLNQAAERAGLPALWHQKAFNAFRGDGYVMGIAADLVDAVVDRFFDSLQSELRKRARGLRADGVELRMRTSLHLGPVAQFDKLLTDSPTGRLMIDSNRMVDAPAVRALLDKSDPEVTFVASVLSGAVMDHVIMAGRTTRRPSEFVEAPLHVDAKEYSGTGYLRVPAPSGALLRFGLLTGQPESPAADVPQEAPKPDSDSQVTNTVHGSAGNILQARDIVGNVDTRPAPGVNNGTSIIGNGNVTAGRDVDQSAGHQQFPGTFQAGGDADFGPSSGRRGNGDAETGTR